MKAVTLKIDDKRLQLLNNVAKTTHVPKSALIRKGIDLVLRQAKEEVLSLELRQEIDKLLTEDRNLIKRLAKA